MESSVSRKGTQAAGIILSGKPYTHKSFNVLKKNVKIVQSLFTSLDLDPRCLSFAYNAGELLFTCKNCHKQLHDLKNVMRKRTKATYEVGRNKTRVGLKGFRNEYAKHGEELEALKQYQSAKKESEEKSNALIKELNKPQKWTDLLLQSCLNGDEAKLVEDLVKPLQTSVSVIQITVIRNLVSKLKSKNNTKYVEIIKDLSALHKK